MLVLCGCVSPREPLQTGNGIIIAGHAVATGARVVTWKDPGGLDAYRAALPDDSGNPQNHGVRRTIDEEPVAAGDLAALIAVVDQIVLHYDGLGSSRRCFEMLRTRQLSAHFLIDADGTIYQTLDLKERAYHATIANSRSIGIEIANVGAYPAREKQGSAPLAEGREERVQREQVRGTIQGIDLVQEEFNDEQYAALSALIDTLCNTFTRIERRVPRDADGNVVTFKLPDEELAKFRGILGHFHVQADKVDPGPAFEWERLW